MRREIPLLVTAIVGVFMIISFFIPHPHVTDIAGDLKDWFLVIAAFAVVLGVGNLLRVNIHRIRRRGQDWGFKIVTLVALIGYAVVGLVWDVNLDVRSHALSRSLGVYQPKEKELLEGRERLLDRREEVASVIEAAGDEAAAREALVVQLGLDPDAVAPDLAALGADGVRALEATAVFGDLQAARDDPGTMQRRIRELEGRLDVTGLRPVVRETLGEFEGEGGRRRALMVRFAFTWDQATDLIALGPQGVADVSAEEVQSGLAALLAAEPDETAQPAYWIFTYVMIPLQATMFSLLAFFIASAAFRAFRMRSLEAGLLLAAGLLVIIGRVPLGQFDWFAWTDQVDEFGFHTIMSWIMNVPNTAAMRGVLMGAAMGVIVMGLKVILGIERSYLGGEG